MFESLYKNIGGKVKALAQWIFALEAISAIISGIWLLSEEEGIGFLVLFLGPLVALASSWILYAFGELVEDMHEMRDKKAAAAVNIPTVLNEAPAYTAPKQTAPVVAAETPVNMDKAPNTANAPVSAEIKNGEKVCPKCGTAQRADRRVCWSCGQHFDN